MAEKLKNMGKITEIKGGNKRSKRVNIFIDGRLPWRSTLILP